VFDTVIIRGGTMFFADPVVAFGNLARSLGRGGRLAMVVSRGPLDKEWIATALTAKAPYLDSVDLEFTDQPQLVGWPEGLSGSRTACPTWRSGGTRWRSRAAPSYEPTD
jgi:hypothetical protein